MYINYYLIMLFFMDSYFLAQCGIYDQNDPGIVGAWSVAMEELREKKG